MTEQRKIVAVKKDGAGRIIEFKFEDDTVVDYKQAIEMAKNGQIAHGNAFKGRDGDFHIRSDADGDPSNNFDNLPQF
jgi:predicted ribosome quality control (RQC) complex YloA/Tae2 family protein